MANLTGAGCRAARALLKWSVRDLAREAGVSPTTVNLIELGRPFRRESADKIAAAFDREGVELQNGDSPGARFRPGRAQ